jgi:AcrR family transcriptional regulator
VPRHVDVEARRDQVLEAVWRVAARDGLDAVSARSVAAEAGLSLGAITRLHPRQEQLHVEAMLALQQRVQARLATHRDTTDAVADAERRLGEVLALDDASHTEAVVFYAYVARARTTPSLRQVADQVDRALALMCVDAVDAVAPWRGVDDRAERARELHALTEGLAYGLVTWPHQRSRDEARAVLRSWLERVSRPG